MSKPQDDEIKFNIGDFVDVEWISGEFWRNGVLISICGEESCVRLPTGWHVYPKTSCLREILTHNKY